MNKLDHAVLFPVETGVGQSPDHQNEHECGRGGSKEFFYCKCFLLDRWDAQFDAVPGQEMPLQNPSGVPILMPLRRM